MKTTEKTPEKKETTQAFMFPFAIVNGKSGVTIRATSRAEAEKKLAELQKE